jgi:hypothetical protein
LPAKSFYFLLSVAAKRTTVNEFPGNERVRVVPEKLTISVFGETSVGSSDVS